MCVSVGRYEKSSAVSGATYVCVLCDLCTVQVLHAPALDLYHILVSLTNLQSLKYACVGFVRAVTGVVTRTYFYGVTRTSTRVGAACSPGWFSPHCECKM